MKKKLNNMTQTHGKVENFEYKSIDQIFGENGSSKYKTLNLEKYTEYLHELNKSDLQSHAIKVGLLPMDNRDTLIKRLTKEFIKYTSAYKIPKQEKNEIKLTKNIKDILSEGR